MLTIKKILCPVDFSEPSYKGLDFAVDLAKLFQAELVVLHVLQVLPPRYTFEVPEFEGIMHNESEQQLKDDVAMRVPSTIKTKILVGHGNAAKQIIEIAKEEDADLIAIATQGHSGWEHLVMGSVAEKVVRHAHCPVFAVRERRS
jgi:universal stress protein A